MVVLFGGLMVGVNLGTAAAGRSFCFCAARTPPACETAEVRKASADRDPHGKSCGTVCVPVGEALVGVGEARAGPGSEWATLTRICGERRGAARPGLSVLDLLLGVSAPTFEVVSSPFCRSC
jgi:hypothetical protein